MTQSSELKKRSWVRRHPILTLFLFSFAFGGLSLYQADRAEKALIANMTEEERTVYYEEKAKEAEARRVAAERGAEVDAAARCAKRKVKSMLKSPSSAKFIAGGPSISQSGSKWNATGVVESQNSFGVMVRSNYSCAVDADTCAAVCSVQ